MQNEWVKHISVNTRIVRLLSASTYEDFPSAIREIVSNAYDADATRVDITIDLEKDYIEINDNGIGMTPEQFDYYLTIAGTKYSSRTTQELNRERIGQFGIGFLAIFPFGDLIKITSSALRSDVKFVAQIPSRRFTQQSITNEIVGNIPINGYQINNKEFLNINGTNILITGLTDLVKRFYEKKSPTIKPSKNTILDWSPDEKLKWILEEDLPLPYPIESQIGKSVSFLDLPTIRVFLNKKELFRNTTINNILDINSWNNNGVECVYYIGTNWKAISPVEERFLKQRIKNVGIGKRTSFDLGLSGRAFSRLHWISGEIYLTKGFDNLLSIDRARFIDNPEFDAYKAFFQQKISYFANYVENISEIKTDIDRQILNSKLAKVGSKIDIINKKINDLEAKGFSLEKTSYIKSKKDNDPVKIDLANKKVVITQNHPLLTDTLYLDGKPINLSYDSSSKGGEDFFVIKTGSDGNLIINSDYRLFKSKRYGEIIKNILIILYKSLEEKNIANSIFIEFIKNLEKELDL